MEEAWKDIIGWEGLYRVSDRGKIYSYRSSRCIKGVPDGGGYRQVYLCRNGNMHRCVIHRLVAMHFIPNPENKPEVNHIDADKGNNSVDNLEWVTPSENIKHSFRIGIMNRHGENHPGHKLNEVDVRNIKKLLRKGIHPTVIHKKYKGIVSDATIYDIKAGRTWTKVNI